MTSYKNRIKIEMKRLHVDYGEDPFTIEGKVFLRSLKSQRVDSYLNVLSGLENEVKKIDRDLKKYEDIDDVKLTWTPQICTTFRVHSRSKTFSYLPICLSNHFFLKTLSMAIRSSNSSGVR